MNTEGIKITDTITGYKNLILLLETSPNIKDSKRVAERIKNTIPIASVGPANNGKI